MRSGKANRDRRRKWLRKAKPVVLAGSVALAALLVLGGTLAWFTSADTETNRVKREEPAKEFIVMEVDVFPPGQDYEEPVEKRVGAQNVGDIPAFVRLLVLPKFFSAEGRLLPAGQGIVLGRPGDTRANVIVEDFNLATWNGATSMWENGDWAQGGDGYYYYLHRLDPGSSTDIDDLDRNLFNTLTFLAMPEGYEDATLVIEVKCEALEVGCYRSGWWGLDDGTPPAAPPFSNTIVNIDARLQTQTGG